MDMDFIQGSDLLSSISNISVKIDYNEREDLGFFHNSVHQNQILYQNQKYAVINALPDEQPIDPECLFEKILAKVSTQTNASYDQNNFWVFDEDLIGISQQLQIPVQKLQTKLQPKKKRIIQKRKSSLKRKSHKRTKKGQCEEMKRRLLDQIRQRNETKNIPKNYGKAIISFASKPNQEVKHITQLNFVNYEDFKKELKQVKKSICTIADLRSLWVDFKYAKVMRIVGDLFLRKYSLKWVFNSKISNINAHVKYRHKLLEAIKEPDSFQYMKHN